MQGKVSADIPNQLHVLVTRTSCQLPTSRPHVQGGLCGQLRLCLGQHSMLDQTEGLLIYLGIL